MLLLVAGAAAFAVCAGAFAAVLAAWATVAGLAVALAGGAAVLLVLAAVGGLAAAVTTDGGAEFDLVDLAATGPFRRDLRGAADEGEGDEGEGAGDAQVLHGSFSDGE